MKGNGRIITAGGLLVLLWMMCSCSHKKNLSAFHFTQMPAEKTGVAFNNKITESDSVNIYTNEYMYNGSGVAVGDFNNDGLPDIFFGGSMVSSKLYINKGGFRFEDVTASAGLQTAQWCTGISVADVNGDGLPDIYVCASHSPDPEKRKKLLFINDGNLHFTEQGAAYGLADTGCATQAAFFDYDGDGDLDVFIGGRLLPQKYPQSPRSYLLQNNGGKFTDVTKTVCPDLEYAGLITGAVFADFTGDKKPDLVICGEWMPVRFFQNRAGKFTEVTGNTGMLNLSGQWRSLEAADLDGDGDTDFIAGNLGLNNKFHVAPGQPLKLYAGDFIGNNAYELIPAYYQKAVNGQYHLFPALDRAQLADQIPSIKKTYLLSADYASVTMPQLLNKLSAKDMMVKECETTTTVWLENLGNGKFASHALPVEAQLAPVNAIIADDFDGDGLTDLLLGGNEYGTEFSTGRYDASYGLFLKGTGGGKFITVRPYTSGFIADGDIKSMKSLSIKKTKNILVGFNNDSLKCFATMARGLKK